MSRVYVGHLPSDVRSSEVRDLFSKFGRIRSVDVKARFAFLEFDDERDASDAVRDMDGYSFDGERIVVEIAKSRRRETRESDGPVFRVVVENIDSRVSWQDLKDFIRKATDRVRRTDVFRDGTGIAEFSSENDMHDVIDRLDGKDLRGKVVRIRQDKGSSSGSRRRSRSRSPSRSPSPRRRSRSPRGRGRSPSRDRSRSRSPRR
eukprot:TRINITY_DN3654_c0_g4_i1.p1 TRINITY_DN3654_c0_g4~~TRINITY_DN3654_c0_g4_i1.p1  ORF type:complete len:204 (-),score=48.91 TRINITY_DN3654_c0_g4_i1:468-1079(-)